MSTNSSSTAVERADVSLLPNLNRPQVNCLNEAPSHGIKEMINSSTAYLESDVDEQLMLNLVFNQKARVKAISLRTADGSEAQAPKEIRLIINKPDIGFDDVEDETIVVQKLSLTPEQCHKGALIPLRYVKYQNVHSLHIFVYSNAGEADTTRIDSIDVFGTIPEAPKDISNLGKDEDHDHK